MNKRLDPVPFELIANGALKLDPTAGYSLSPDGDLFAYSERTNKLSILEKNNQGSSKSTAIENPSAKMVILNTDDGSYYHLEVPADRCKNPSWAPNSQKLAFIAENQGIQHLYIWTRGEKLDRLPVVLSAPQDETDIPRWGSDSKTLLCKCVPMGALSGSAHRTHSAKTDVVNAAVPSIVVLSNDSEIQDVASRTIDRFVPSLSDLLVIDTEDGSFFRIEHQSLVSWYMFSSDEKYIAYTILRNVNMVDGAEMYDLALYELKTNTKRIVRKNLKLFRGGLGCAWCPNGAYILCRIRSAVKTIRDNDVDLMMVAIKEETDINININVDINYQLTWPLWSQSGSSIYVIGTEKNLLTKNRSQFTRHDKLWKLDVGSTECQLVLEIPSYQIVGIVTSAEPNKPWRSIDQNIWVIAKKKQGNDFPDESGIYRVSLATSEYALAHKANIGWYKSEMDSSGRKIFAISSDFKCPQKFSIFLTADPEQVNIHALNSTWDQYVLGNAEIRRYIGPEGRALRSGLMLPASFRKSQRVPLVVFTFGYQYDADRISEFGLFGALASYNVHALTTRGYAVLHPDMPLRTGMQVQDVYDSVISGVNHVLNEGLIDPARLAVIGYSVGSYSALSLIAQSAIFKAAIIGGVSIFPDLFAAYLMTDPRNSPLSLFEQDEGYLSMGGSPWDVRDRYTRNSLSYLLDKITTPVLLTQGTADGLHASNAIFTGLRRLKKSVEYRIYVGEDHPISRPENVLDVWTRRIEFLDQHLHIKRDQQGNIIYGNDAVL